MNSIAAMSLAIIQKSLALKVSTKKTVATAKTLKQKKENVINQSLLSLYEKFDNITV